MYVYTGMIFVEIRKLFFAMQTYRFPDVKRDSKTSAFYVIQMKAKVI